MRAVKLVSEERLRTLTSEVTAEVVKSAAPLQALQQLLRQEVPCWRIAVLGLTYRTPPAPVGPAQSGEALTADGVSRPTDQDWGAPGDYQADRTLQLLRNVDISQQQLAQINTLNTIFFSRHFLTSFHLL